MSKAISSTSQRLWTGLSFGLHEGKNKVSESLFHDLDSMNPGVVALEYDHAAREEIQA